MEEYSESEQKERTDYEFQELDTNEDFQSNYGILYSYNNISVLFSIQLIVDMYAFATWIIYYKFYHFDFTSGLALSSVYHFILDIYILIASCQIDFTTTKMTVIIELILDLVLSAICTILIFSCVIKNESLKIFSIDICNSLLAQLFLYAPIFAHAALNFVAFTTLVTIDGKKEKDNNKKYN